MSAICFSFGEYALAEADFARRRLAREEHDFLVGLCRGLNMDANGAIRLHFTDFLYGTRRLRGKEWKLVKQPLVDGYVLLTKDRFLRVVEAHLQNRFEKELPLEVTEALLRAFEDNVMELRQELETRRPKLETPHLGLIRVTNFPPCMQKLLAAVLESENVSHPGAVRPGRLPEQPGLECGGNLPHLRLRA